MYKIKIFAKTCFMVIIFIRTTLTFIVLLTVMRLMGKRQIGEMQPFEFVITLLIAELACLPLADVSIPLIYGIVAVLAVFILHQLISILEGIGQPMKRVFSGKPSLVINKDGIDLNELKKNNLDVEDLISAMRNAGYYSFDSLAYAIFESNGTLSALPNLNYDEVEPQLPILLINNGKKINNNCSLIHLPDDFFDKVLFSQNIKNIKDVTVMTIDGKGKIYLQEKNKKYLTFSVDLPQGVKW